MKRPTQIRIWRSIAGNSRHAIIGTCYFNGEGWFFMPNVSGRQRSKRAWPTWEACLPRWTGGLDGTSSEVIREIEVEQGK